MKHLVLLVVILFLFGCGSSQGTNTGNPNALPSTPNSGTAPGPVENIITSLCGRIATCKSLSSVANATCTSQITSLANFTDEITLNPPYTTLNDLKTASDNGTFTFNSTSLSICTGAIDQLACSDTLMTSAYSVSTPNDFSKAYFLFRSSSHCLSLKQ